MSDLLATLWTVAYQAPLSIGFSRQEYWSGVSFPSPGDLPNPGIKPGSPELQTETLLSEPPVKPFVIKYTYKRMYRLPTEDGGGIGWGDHFLPYKFIERTFER